MCVCGCASHAAVAAAAGVAVVVLGRGGKTKLVVLGLLMRLLVCVGVVQHCCCIQSQPWLLEGNEGGERKQEEACGLCVCVGCDGGKMSAIVSLWLLCACRRVWV